MSLDVLLLKLICKQSSQTYFGGRSSIYFFPVYIWHDVFWVLPIQTWFRHSANIQSLTLKSSLKWLHIAQNFGGRLPNFGQNTHVRFECLSDSCVYTWIMWHDPPIRHSTGTLTFFGSERMPMILWTKSSDFLWPSDEPHEQSATKRWLALKKIWLPFQDSHHFKCYFHQLAFVISRKRSHRRWVWSNFSVSIYIWNNIFPPEIAWTKLFLPEYNIYLKLYSAKLKRSKYFVMFQFFQVWFPMFLKSCTSQILSFAFL